LIDELHLYKTMLTIRLLEDELQKLCLSGEAGDLHFNKGQEAISVGACAALRPTDYMVTHHRTIAHSIAKGVPLRPLVAELLGKATGINKGMAGEMHIRYPKKRYMFSFQLVGTCLAVAAGVAWAAKYYMKEEDIVACFFGDAATSNGLAHEGINIASVRKAPLLLVCENNGLAGNVRKEFYLPTDTVSERAAAYGIDSNLVDGNRVLEVFEAVESAAKLVREQSKPYLLEMKTDRQSWHKQGQPDSRSREEIAELTKRDPIAFEERRLKVSREQRERFEKEIQAEIRASVDAARKAPWPEYSPGVDAG
jgi:TPP-dependent pyruvate/acetoin dehydrogenase alpha subunit